MVAAHRIQGYPHGLLLLVLFFGNDFAALGVVPAAIPAHDMGQDGVAATIAVGILPRLEMVVAPPRTLASVGHASFRYSHDRSLSRNKADSGVCAKLMARSAYFHQDTE
jgi:hypothetical protein